MRRRATHQPRHRRPVPHRIRHRLVQLHARRTVWLIRLVTIGSSTLCALVMATGVATPVMLSTVEPGNFRPDVRLDTTQVEAAPMSEEIRAGDLTDEHVFKYIEDDLGWFERIIKVESVGDTVIITVEDGSIERTYDRDTVIDIHDPTEALE